MDTKKPGQDGTKSCGTNTTFNFVVGVVAVVVAIAAGYYGYTQFLK